MSINKLFITLGLIAFLVFNLGSPVVAQTQPTCSPEQRKEFLLTAVDGSGNVIDKLRAEHLSLKVGGTPAMIADVVFQSTSALDLAVMIDASMSQEQTLPIAKAAARAFATSVASAGQDRVAVISFSNKPIYHQVMSSELEGVAAAINQIQLDIPPGYVGGGVVMSVGKPPTPNSIQGSTSLWDAVRTATTELFSEKPEKRRRAILLFTDGIDTSSSGKLNAVIEEANKRDVAVFTLGLVSDKVGPVDEQALKKLSEQTGAIAEFPGKKKEKLEAALTQIARHFRGSYVVGYCGGSAKDRAKLQVEISDPEMRKAIPGLVYKRY
jgi:VWFA-related protein